MPAGIEFCLLRPLVVRVPLVAHRSRLGDPALSSPASRFRSGSVTPGTSRTAPVAATTDPPSISANRTPATALRGQRRQRSAAGCWAGRVSG